jgi:hypothetical protein
MTSLRIYDDVKITTYVLLVDTTLKTEHIYVKLT